MKKAQLVPVASLFQRRFQTADLPQQNLFVVASLIVQFIKPAAGSTKSHIMIKQAVIVQDFKGIQTVFRKEPLHLGGVVGLNLYLDFVGESTTDALVAHVERFLELGGEKTLCLGGDLDGCEALAGGMTGIQDMPKLYGALIARGYDEALLEDIFWNNLRRLI